jgi:hypothetical protein
LLSLPTYWLLRWRQKRRRNPLREAIANRWLRAGVNLLGFLGFVSFTFQWMWAFNYQRVPVEEQLGFIPQPLSEEEIRAEFHFATVSMLGSRNRMGEPEKAMAEMVKPSDELAGKVRSALAAKLEGHHYPTPGRVRLKSVRPSGALMYFGAAGVYLPWAGESYRPADLPVSHLPFLMAHEMAHGYGFADEGSANFWAYVACNGNEDPYVAYSGDLHYWKYVAREMMKVDTAAFGEVRRNLPRGIQLDLQAEREHSQSYDTWFSGLTFLAYNSYLKSQGVKEGYTSYSRIVTLVRAYSLMPTPEWDEMREPGDD